MEFLSLHFQKSTKLAHKHVTFAFNHISLLKVDNSWDLKCAQLLI